jgi:hypothetical protein
MRFEPKPNDTLILFGERYVVQPHPSASHIAYSSEAGRAFVYQLKGQKGDYFALKVIKPKFRGANLADSPRHLVSIEKFEGLRAANRSVVLPEEPIVKTFPALEYAMLMPWISGSTWFDVLNNAKNHGTYFDSPFAIKLCAQFLNVMAALEQAGYAHSDISPGNLIVGKRHPDVQLIDLEDMYLPGAPAPAEDYTGSPGYRHHSGDQGATTWRSEGDRYATAVMAAEMLVLTNRKLARLATDTGYFASHCLDEDGAKRFDSAKGLLTNTAPGFARLFKQAWFSDSLGDCPKIADLRASLDETPAKPAIRITSSLPKVTGVAWSALDGAKVDATVTVDIEEPISSPSRTAKAPPGFWGNAPQPEQKAEPQVTSRPPQQTQPQSKVWVIVLAIVALILFLVWLASVSNQGARNNTPSPEPTLAVQTTQTPVAISSMRRPIPSPTSPAPEATIATQRGQEQDAAAGGGADAGVLTVNAIDGAWVFSTKDWNITLTIKNGVGQFASIMLYALDQTVTSAAPPSGLRGIVLKGAYPTLSGTRIQPSRYAPDEILLLRQTGGSFKAWVRDNVYVKEWETLQVDSFKPGADWEESYGDDLTMKNIAGVWKFSNFSEGKYPAVLVIREGRGIFRTQTAIRVTEQARAEIIDQGILVSCFNPMLSDDGVSAPNFSPDKLLFQRQDDGSFRVWLRDDVTIKNWTHLKVISHP